MDALEKCFFLLFFSPVLSHSHSDRVFGTFGRGEWREGVRACREPHFSWANEFENGTEKETKNSNTTSRLSPENYSKKIAKVILSGASAADC